MPDVAVSDELFAPVSPGVELCYQTFGDPDDEPLLLVMGLGGPMTWWDPDFCRLLAGRGFHVIRYDNRDTGRSSRIPGRVTRSALVRAFSGGRVRAPYAMSDLAEDAFGLLDHLGFDSAHVAGVSMGGMIVADHGDPAAGTGPLADQHHVDDREADRGLAAPVAAAQPDRRSRGGPRGLRAGERADVAADRLPGVPADLRADPGRERRRRSTGA